MISEVIAGSQEGSGVGEEGVASPGTPIWGQMMMSPPWWLAVGDGVAASVSVSSSLPQAAR